jgi:hypothetical protein
MGNYSEMILSTLTHFPRTMIYWIVKWYLFYHVAGPSNWERRVCAVPLSYNDDETILPIEISTSIGYAVHSITGRSCLKREVAGCIFSKINPD